MPLYMLDTNAACAAIRGVAGFDQRLDALAPGDWCISAVTRSELVYGVALLPEATRLAPLVGAFLQAAITAPWDELAADFHCRLRAELRLAGTPIGSFDEMIAGHALACGAILVTDNIKHFARVNGLKLENWLRPGSPISGH